MKWSLGIFGWQPCDIIIWNGYFGCEFTNGIEVMQRNKNEILPKNENCLCKSITNCVCFVRCMLVCCVSMFLTYRRLASLNYVLLSHHFTLFLHLQFPSSNLVLINVHLMFNVAVSGECFLNYYDEYFSLKIYISFLRSKELCRWQRWEFSNNISGRNFKEEMFIYSKHPSILMTFFIANFFHFFLSDFQILQNKGESIYPAILPVEWRCFWYLWYLNDFKD